MRPLTYRIRARNASRSVDESHLTRQLTFVISRLSASRACVSFHRAPLRRCREASRLALMLGSEYALGFVGLFLLPSVIVFMNHVAGAENSWRFSAICRPTNTLNEAVTSYSVHGGLQTSSSHFCARFAERSSKKEHAFRYFDLEGEARAKRFPNESGWRELGFFPMVAHRTSLIQPAIPPARNLPVPNGSPSERSPGPCST